MIEIIKELNIEVSKPNVFQAIVAKQYDMNTRFVKATFVDDGEKIYIDPDATVKVVINALRPDGESKGFDGEVNQDGTVTVPLHSWMLEQVGTVTCDISVIDMAEDDQKKLTTTSFTLIVEKAAWGGDGMTNDPQYNLLIEVDNADATADVALEKANRAIDLVDGWEADAESAREIVETNETIIGAMNSRLDEAIAMRGTGGAVTYQFAGGVVDGLEIHGAISTNGFGVYVDLEFRTVDIAPESSLTWKGLPQHLIPLCSVADMTHYDKYGLVVYFRKETIDGVEVPVVIFYNPTSEPFDSTKLPTINVEYSYPLATPFIPELEDIRVGYNGTKYDTAGAAVRGQLTDAINYIEPALEELQERVEHIEENGGSITVDEELDGNSTNPIQNKAVTNAINRLEDTIRNLNVGGGTGGGAGLPDVSDAINGVALVVKDGKWVVGAVPVATKAEISEIRVYLDALNGRMNDLEAEAGDLDEALDSIIAIQEELITGGTELPMAEEESF